MKTNVKYFLLVYSQDQCHVVTLAVLLTRRLSFLCQQGINRPMAVVILHLSSTFDNELDHSASGQIPCVLCICNQSDHKCHWNLGHDLKHNQNDVIIFSDFCVKFPHFMSILFVKFHDSCQVSCQISCQFFVSNFMSSLVSIIKSSFRISSTYHWKAVMCHRSWPMLLDQIIDHDLKCGVKADHFQLAIRPRGMLPGASAIMKFSSSQ